MTPPKTRQAAIMSFVVAERTQEIGIRNALGAQKSAIVTLVLRRSLAQIGTGALVGIPLAYLTVNRSFDTWGEGLVFALALGVGVMVLIGTLACTAPTLRALRIHPTEALRGLD